MDKRTLIAAAIAIAVVGGALALVLVGTRKHHLKLTGEILKVRTHAIDNENALAILDFRVTNPSAERFVLREALVTLETADGKNLEGENASEVDAQRLFQHLPQLGQKYNDTLKIRDRINPGQTVDRMLAVRLPTSADRIQNRKAIRIRLLDVDGQASEIVTRAAGG